MVDNMESPKTPSPQQQQQQPEYHLDLLDSLRHHSLFQQMDNEAFLTKLTSVMNVRTYNPKDIIINKGEPSKAMFFLLTGQVDICSGDFERIYATLTQGSYFGEIGILYDMPRTATVVSTTKCTLATLSSDQVNTLLSQFPDVDKMVRFEAEERLDIMNKVDSQQQQQQQQKQPILTTTIEERQRHKLPMQYNVETFNKTAIRTHLDKMPFFFGCSDNFLNSICLSIQLRNYEPNTVIFNQADQGDEMYFIVNGFVDIEKKCEPSNVYGRLGPGGYFGDTTVLLNLPRPTTIKTVTQMECYALNRIDLQKVCDQFPGYGNQLKRLAETRFSDITNGNFNVLSGSLSMTMNEIQPQSIMECRAICGKDPTSATIPASKVRKLETARGIPSLAACTDPLVPHKINISSLEQKQSSPPSPPPSLKLIPSPSWATSKSSSPLPTNADRLTTLKSSVLIHLMTFLDFATLIEMMRLNKSTYAIYSSPNNHALDYLDLSTLHNKITDDTLTSFMSSPPFLRHRHQLRSLSLYQCFHLTDLGLHAIFHDESTTTKTLPTVQELFFMMMDWERLEPQPQQPLLIQQQQLHSLNLTSCWQLSDQSLQWIGDQCPGLVHLDLSNCRKITNDGIYLLLMGNGKIKLRWLSLSYCKHLTDTTMKYLANYACDSMVYLNLQRCTAITDLGFQNYWTPGKFLHLQEMVLMDCSFLTDVAIQYLMGSAIHLHTLKISFCCSLTADVMWTLGGLVNVDLSYCGTAVSDLSLQQLATTLLTCGNGLKRLNLRGCVRVTGQGILTFLQHQELQKLVELNISQCTSIPFETKQDILDRNLVQQLII